MKSKLEQAKQKHGRLLEQLNSTELDFRQRHVTKPNRLLARYRRLTKSIISSGYNLNALQVKFQNASTVASVSQYRRLLLRVLCAQICELPTELRDMIYQNILDSELCETDPGFDQCNDNPDSDSNSEGGMSVGYILRLRGACSYTYHDVSFNHECFESSECGAIVARDLAQMSHPRQIALDPGQGGLQSFLSQDRWCLGLRPVDLVHHFRICVSEDLMSPDDENHQNMWSDLKALSLLKKGAAITVAFQIKESMGRCLVCGYVHPPEAEDGVCGRLAEDFASFCVRVRPICEFLERLEATGYNLTVKIDEEPGIKYLLYKQGQNEALISTAVQCWLDEQRNVSPPECLQCMRADRFAGCRKCCYTTLQKLLE